MEKLLLLDINGVLCYRTTEDISGELVIKLPKCSVALRPGYQIFLDFCYYRYKIAFFSSTTYQNANDILETLLTPNQKKRTLFRWFRDRTHYDPDTNDHSTIKLLSDVFDNPVVNSYRQFTSRNTLLCDDSPSKIRFNNPNNIVLINPFEGDSNDRTLFELMNIIPSRFDYIQSS